jgi:hypothetical protein
MLPSRDWERLYTAAILETDRSKLESRIDAAEAAIDRRLKEMSADHGGNIRALWAAKSIFQRDRH